MFESHFSAKGACSFIRHTKLESERKTMLFLHGLGDSSLSYLPFLKNDLLSAYNVIVPDFIGYGKSVANEAGNFSFQIEALLSHLSYLETKHQVQLRNYIIIPHSMAAIHAMLLYQSSIKPRIKGIVSVEGTVTQFGSFISEAVTKITEKGDDFYRWFQGFVEISIYGEFLKKFPCCRSYYASLKFCQPRIFLMNALEMRKIALSGEGKYTNLAGDFFANVPLKKLYCYGDKSLCQESVTFLKLHNVPVKIFQTDNHFVMLQCIDEFTKDLVAWAEQLK